MTSPETSLPSEPPPPSSNDGDGGGATGTGGHGPKRMALAALAANRLSREGRRRMKAHISACEVCRTEWPRVKDALRAVREARGEPPPLDWERMEKTLSHVALEESRQLRTIRAKERWQKRWGRAWIPAAVVLAAAAAYWLGLRAGRPAETETPPRAPIAERPDRRERPPVRPDERTRLTVRSTAMLGRLAIRHASGSATETATIDSAFGEGDTAEIADAAGAFWDARLCAGAPCAANRGAAIHVESGSRLTLTSVRDGWVELGLSSGGVTADAAPLGEGERFAIVAGDLAVRVRGTRFRVSMPDASDPQTVLVEVARGVVEVVHLPSGRHNVLEAPARAQFVRGVMQDRRALEGELVTPHGAGDTLSSWVPITLPALGRNVRSWRFVDGPGGGAGADGVLRMREGAATLEWTFVDGRVEQVPVDLRAGITVAPTETPVAAPRGAAGGTLSREEINRVVSAGVPGVRRCYEHRLRRRPELAATSRVVVRVRIGIDGAVDEARITGAEVPTELRECVVPAVRAWRFPPPRGGAVTVELPMSFTGR